MALKTNQSVKTKRKILVSLKVNGSSWVYSGFLFVLLIQFFFFSFFFFGNYLSCNQGQLLSSFFSDGFSHSNENDDVQVHAFIQKRYQLLVLEVNTDLNELNWLYRFILETLILARCFHPMQDAILVNLTFRGEGGGGEGGTGRVWIERCLQVAQIINVRSSPFYLRCSSLHFLPY